MLVHGQTQAEKLAPATQIGDWLALQPALREALPAFPFGSVQCVVVMRDQPGAACVVMPHGMQ